MPYEPKPYELKWEWKDWMRLALLGGSDAGAPSVTAYRCPRCCSLVVTEPEQDVRMLHELWHLRSGSL
jgi:hypothetical protein